MPVGRHRSGLLTAGGVLTIIAGVLGIGGGIGLILLAAGIAWWGWAWDWSLEVQQWFQLHGTGWLLAPGIVFIILGAVAIAGGINALRVKNWGWALAGAICGIFTTFIFGLLGLIFIADRKRDFA